MSPEEGDKTTCYSLSADAVVRSPRMGRQLGCRPSLAAWRIAPESIFLKGFGAWSVLITIFCCSWIILFRLLSASVSVSPFCSRQPSTFRLQALTCMFTVMTHSKEELTPFPSSPSAFVSHLTPRRNTALGLCSAGTHTHVSGTHMLAKAEVSQRSSGSGFHIYLRAAIHQESPAQCPSWKTMELHPSSVLWLYSSCCSALARGITPPIVRLTLMPLTLKGK